MKVFKKISTGNKVVNLIMDGVAILALTGVGAIGLELTAIHKRMDKIELLDAKIGEELEEYFRYADEQKKKIEGIKELRKGIGS